MNSLSITRRRVPLEIGALVIFILAASCRLGSGYAIGGTILDTSGIPVTGVTVILKNSGLDSVTSGDDGKYSFTNAPAGSWAILGFKTGMMLIPKNGDGSPLGAVVVLGGSREKKVDFLALIPGELTIPMIQGSGFKSPLEGQSVNGVVGIVTQVTRRAPHAIYDTVLTDGTTTPQWVSEDGFYMECLAADKDGDAATSDGIFVYTHDESYTESKWINDMPTDLEPGDVVSVNGSVSEYVPIDRFGESTGFLSVTRIIATSANHVYENGVEKSVLTTAFPAGVLLTYEDSPTLPSGVTEFRTLPWEDSGKLSLLEAEKKMESVEGMVVRVNKPLVVGSTYYNVTGILADAGKKANVLNSDINTDWGGIVLQDPANPTNPTAVGMDFNSEILFCDYQKASWATFNPIPQVGDLIKDSVPAYVLRGVMDYTADAVYMIKPLQFTAGSPKDSAGNTIPSQGWDFDVSAVNSDMASDFKALSSAKISSGGSVYDNRIGSTCASRFKPSWTKVAIGDTSDKHLTFASFNIENYEAQGGSYKRQNDIANIIINNLQCPDVITLIEMGDDKASINVYVNQAGSYAIEDGVVTSVLNFRGIIDAIASKGGPAYEFVCVDPEENKDGGAPGINIRPGILYRTDRVGFVARGLTTNTYLNTCVNPNVRSTTVAAESEWPVTFPSNAATMLATTGTSVSIDPNDHTPALTQSPGRIIAPAFAGSVRKPFVGEFLFKPITTGNNKFFVIGAHLSSKSGDTTLYGDQQPPSFGSDPRRAEQGAVIKHFVDSILSRDENAFILVGGDMNDFPWSDALKAMSGEGTSAQSLYSVSRCFMYPKQQFSYSYRGNLQQIDHILFSPALYEKARTAGVTKDNNSGTIFIPHIDSVYSKNNHVQNSDHDPIVIRVDMGGL